jgi:hypothetical protein
MEQLQETARVKCRLRRPVQLDSTQYYERVRTSGGDAMARAQTIPLTRHRYADGSFKKMLIDGQWVAAASGKTFESRNPATGELLDGGGGRCRGETDVDHFTGLRGAGC